MEYNSIFNEDCIEYMKTLSNNAVNMTFTDIPYGAVNRDSNGLRILDKSKADIMTFDLDIFLAEVYRITSSTIVIFCGKEQLSEIFNFFAQKQKQKKGTVRQLIWQKTNPSPMNGQYVYLSGIENAVWFKKRGGLLMLIVKTLFFNILTEEAKSIPLRRTMIY